MRKHIIITGTGRTGTSFLIQLMTNIGLDTGFDKDAIKSVLKNKAHAGLENDIRKENCHYIVKSPWFCDYVAEIVQNNEIILDHIFIPIRDIYAAAESRRRATKIGSSSGCLWNTDSMQIGDQEQILLSKIYKLMFVLSDLHVPLTFIKYPRLTKDPLYLFTKLKPVLKDVAFDYFLDIFNESVRPELVHKLQNRYYEGYSL